MNNTPLIVSGAILFFSMWIVLLLCFGCTVSFQNISTHGTATDLVDENQTSNPNINPNIQIPAL